MKCILTPNLDPPFNLRQIYPNSDHTLAWVIRRNKEVGVIPCESKAERDMCLADYKAKHPNLPLIVLPPIGPHYVVDETDLPDDYFFDCWEWDNGCQVNMPKARGFQMEHVRKVRNVELVKLDVPFMLALEAGNVAEQRRIGGLKRTLRDIPQTFDLGPYETARELQLAWPVRLPVREYKWIMRGAHIATVLK